MKKIALLLSVLLLLTCLVACGDKGNNTNGADSSVNASDGLTSVEDTNSTTESNTSQTESGAASTNSTSSQSQFGNEVEIEAGDWADLLG